MLEVQDLVVDFRLRGGASLRAVNHCSFCLEKGETLALVGESGSGKSTVVRAVGQLVRPTAGTVLLDGVPPGRHGRALRAYRKRVQLIFQDPFASLNPMHTVRHHLARPILMLHPGHSRARLDEEVAELLRSVNLTPAEEIAGKYPHELSGGQRQRVAIARALASGPDVLLADEPVSMLDVSIRLEILNLLDRLKRERNLALLYVTHDLATAQVFLRADHGDVPGRGRRARAERRGDPAAVAPVHAAARLRRTRSRADPSRAGAGAPGAAGGASGASRRSGAGGGAA
jgi:peptide/nickel transport system ATP-binding protein